MGTLRRLRRTCAKVRELSELRFGVLRGVNRCIGVLDRGPRRSRGEVWGLAQILLLGLFIA